MAWAGLGHGRRPRTHAAGAPLAPTGVVWSTARCVSPHGNTAGVGNALAQDTLSCFARRWGGPHQQKQPTGLLASLGLALAHHSTGITASHLDKRLHQVVHQALNQDRQQVWSEQKVCSPRVPLNRVEQHHQRTLREAKYSRKGVYTR